MSANALTYLKFIKIKDVFANVKVIKEIFMKLDVLRILITMKIICQNY